MKSKDLWAKHGEAVAAARKIVETAETEKRKLSDDEAAAFDALGEQIKLLASDAERQELLEAAESRQSAVVRVAVPDTSPATVPVSPSEPDVFDASRIRVPASARAMGQLTAFKGQDAEKRAYAAGLFYRSVLTKNPEDIRKCREFGMDFKAVMSSNTSSGQMLIPPMLHRDIIVLVEEYGVFRKEAQVVPMTTDSENWPRESGTLTAYHVGENPSGGITESNPAFDGVSLTAGEIATLTRYPITLGEDAITSIADIITTRIARAFATTEDNDGFIGDGTSTYGGVMGVVNKINDGSHAGAIKTSASGHTGFETLTVPDFMGLIGKLPQYAMQAGPKFYISQYGAWASLMNLKYTAGGNNVASLTGDGGAMQAFGFPVVITQVLNSTAGADAAAIKCLFGVLRLSSMFGDRRQMTVASSDQRYFEYSQIGIRGTERYAINNHDVGGASAASPMVALKTAGS